MECWIIFVYCLASYLFIRRLFIVMLLGDLPMWLTREWNEPHSFNPNPIHSIQSCFLIHSMATASISFDPSSFADTSFANDVRLNLECATESGDSHKAHIKSELNAENAGRVLLLVSSAFHEIRCPDKCDNHGNNTNRWQMVEYFLKNFQIYCIRFRLGWLSCHRAIAAMLLPLLLLLRCIIRIREWTLMTHFDELFHHKSLLTSLTARIVLEAIKQRMTFWNNTQTHTGFWV